MSSAWCLSVSLRPGRKARRERVRIPKVRRRRLSFWHYRHRPRRCGMLIDPATMTLTRWPGRHVLALLGA